MKEFLVGILAGMLILMFIDYTFNIKANNYPQENGEDIIKAFTKDVNAMDKGAIVTWQIDKCSKCGTEE